MSHYPTPEQVESATRLQLAQWYRFLPSPEDEGEAVALNRIVERFKELGGMTPAISKQIGWGDGH